MGVEEEELEVEVEGAEEGETRESKAASGDEDEDAGRGVWVDWWRVGGRAERRVIWRRRFTGRSVLQLRCARLQSAAGARGDILGRELPIDRLGASVKSSKGRHLLIKQVLGGPQLECVGQETSRGFSWLPW